MLPECSASAGTAAAGGQSLVMRSSISVLACAQHSPGTTRDFLVKTRFDIEYQKQQRKKINVYKSSLYKSMLVKQLNKTQQHQQCHFLSFCCSSKLSPLSSSSLSSFSKTSANFCNLPHFVLVAVAVVACVNQRVTERASGQAHTSFAGKIKQLISGISNSSN